MNQSYRRIAYACLLLSLGFSHGLGAQPKPQGPQGPQGDAYPGKPIRLIVPVAPGGSTDIIARIVANKLRVKLNEQVLVDNRPGAGSIVGSQFVARSAPDGYTLLFAYANHTTTPFMYNDVPYDPLKDFAPISLIATQPLVVMAHPSVPVKSIDELIALAKAKPGTLNYGLTSGGAGHIAAEWFKQLTGTNIVPIPYQGGGPAQIALLSGDVQLLFAAATTAMPQIRAGKIRILATTSKKRLTYLPEVPTFEEVGFRQLEMGSWIGMLAPAGTPRPIIDRLHREIVLMLKEPDVLERLAAAGSDPVGDSPEEFTAHIKRELELFGKVIKTAGIKGN